MPGHGWEGLVIFRKKVVGASERALARFVTRAQREAGLRGRVNVVVTTNRELRDLNRRFRRQDHATDVLSFPSSSTVADGFEGDIAISADIASDNARQLGHAAADELKILALHGMLHLAGYDHERDQGEMARKETRLRRVLKLPEALIARANGATSGAEARNHSAATDGAAKAAPLRKKPGVPGLAKQKAGASTGRSPSLAKRGMGTRDRLRRTR